MSANDKAEDTKNELIKKKDDFMKKLEEDGVVNPKGFAMLGFGAAFIAAVPLTSFLAQPNGLVEKAVNALSPTSAPQDAAAKSLKQARSRP